MFAVIETGGKQHLVHSGDLVTIEKIDGEEGSEVKFDKVLLVGNEDGSDVKVGTPYLSGVSLTGKIEDQGRSKKLRVIKYKRKVRYKRVLGHRQHQTKVRIGEIS